MKTLSALIVIAWFATGCSRSEDAPAAGNDPARSMAKLATTPEQARLWEDAGGDAAAKALREAHLSGDVVQPRKPVEFPNEPSPNAEVPFPESVDTGFAIVSDVALDAPFDGTARVAAVEGEFLTLEFADQRLRLHAKVRGGPLRAKVGEECKLTCTRGQPFARDDVTAFRLADDELVAALVGGNEPVRFEVKSHQLEAQQIDDPERNTVPVRITVAGQSATLSTGEQADFDEGALTVRVLASVAVQGERAHALPGRPYRVELLAWRRVE